MVACPVWSFLVSCLVSYNRNFSCNNVDLKNPGYIWFRIRKRQGKGKRKRKRKRERKRTSKRKRKMKGLGLS